MMNVSLRTRQIITVLAAVGIGAGSALALQTRQESPAPAPAPTPAATAAPMQLPDIATLVERNTPTVVQITVSGKATEQANFIRLATIILRLQMSVLRARATLPALAQRVFRQRYTSLESLTTI